MIFNLPVKLSRCLVTSSLPNFRVVSVNYSSAATSNLAKLRKKTGFAFTLCKKALELHNNDLDKAALWLKEEAIKHGYAKAQKLKTRRAVEGLIGVAVNKETKKCGLLELNCETDFVARNNNFKQLAALLTSKFLSDSDSLRPSSSSPSTNSSLILKNVFSPQDLEIYNDHLSTAVTQLGENIKLSRGLIVQITGEPKGDLLIFDHSHASGESIQPIDGIKLGKYGTVVIARLLPENERKPPRVKEEPNIEKKEPEEKMKPSQEKRELTDEEIDYPPEEEEEDAFGTLEEIEYSVDDVGKILCQQVIGMNPIYLQKSEQILAKEKELKEQGYKIPDETEYLLDQNIIVNANLSVSEFCDDHGVEVIDFVRYECGEIEDQE